jgi:hypothetical protein
MHQFHEIFVDLRSSQALRAENVPYVVAPYEADAQLAYLELSGLVDGIITEDSDLLVFGCRNVLFKLDVSTSTVVSISRSSFSSINGLLGWSDVQFRAMAILSGCDYLASIAGIGLKTAWTLLKKHRTVENVVKALMRDGKKNVPKEYLKAFRLAEKVFLYQRVYDPSSEKLVCLNEVPVGEQWDEEVEAYVGRSVLSFYLVLAAEADRSCALGISSPPWPNSSLWETSTQQPYGRWLTSTQPISHTRSRLSIQMACITPAKGKQRLALKSRPAMGYSISSVCV